MPKVIDKVMDGLPKDDNERLETIEKRVESLTDDERREVVMDALAEILGRDAGRGRRKKECDCTNCRIRRQDGLHTEVAPMDISGHDAAETVITGYKDGPRIHRWNSKMGSVYSPDTDAVSYSPIHEEPEDKNRHWDEKDRLSQRYRVIFHELIHSTGAEKRLARKGMRSHAGEDVYLEEIIAEMGAGMLIEEVGLMTDEMKIVSNDYIKFYAEPFNFYQGLSESDVRSMAFPFAKKAAEYILGRPLSGKLGHWKRKNSKKPATIAKVEEFAAV